MNIINVRKAQPIGRDDADDAPDTIIVIGGDVAGTIPDDEDPIFTMHVFKTEAITLALALRNALPGGTFDRLIANLLEMKASQFRVSHEDIEHNSLKKPAND
jgi:hypothetical protein